MTVDRMAREMFLRRCALDGAEPALAELAWTDPGIRGFWMAEARHVLDLLGGGGRAAVEW